MKLIIDIDESTYDKVCKMVAHINPEYIDYLLEVISNGTPIPDNATNGDVIKAIFEPKWIRRMDDVVREEYEFDAVWWHSPYQKGGK